MSFFVSETIEDGNICVTCHPGIWIKEKNTLMWPPAGSGVQYNDIVEPGPDWVPHPCRVLRENIETFEEAVKAEKMYSRHRDSNSFQEAKQREAEERNNKREHTVKETCANIDVNELIRKIDVAAASSTTEKSNTGGKFSKEGKAYHKSCLEKSENRIMKKPASGGLKKLSPKLKNFLKSKISKPNFNSEKHEGLGMNGGKTPRYPNYLKSGKKSSAPTATITKSSVPTAKITKEQYLKLGSDESSSTGSGRMVHEDDDRTDEILSETGYGEYCRKGTQSASTPHEANIPVLSDRRYAPTSHGLDKDEREDYTGHDVQEPSSSRFEERILRELTDLKNAQKRSEEQRLLFEARMVLKWDSLANDKLQHAQFGNQNRRQIYRPHPTRQVDEDFSADEDFDDLDENFPVKRENDVEDLERSLRRDLEFKFHLRARINELTGKAEKKSIRSIMKYLFVDDVLELYTFGGTEEKSAFKKLKAINNLIFNVVRENFKNYKRASYESYMGEWLKHAKSRQRTVTYTYPKRHQKNQRKIQRNSDSDQDDFE